MLRGAEFSPCRRYRYVLWRTWDPAAATVNFTCLNPSTADEQIDDRTIGRFIGFARDWGYGGLVMTNLFAFRATKPADMRAAVDPVGPDNDAWLVKVAGCAGLVVAAWGNDGSHLRRDEQVRWMLPALHCLRLTKTGQSGHPLYVRGDVTPRDRQRVASTGSVGRRAGEG
jgi:hypothetical protein